MNAVPVPASEPLDTAPRLYDRRTLASLLVVSLRTLDRLDAAGKLPPAVRLGAAKRWTREVVEEWLRLGCPGRDVPAEGGSDQAAP